MCIVPYLYIQISTGSPNCQFGQQATTRWGSLSKPANIRIIIPGGEVVEVAIGIELFAGELSGVIAGACLISYSPKDIIPIADKDILVIIG